jgi:UDP-N-acetylglucosamine:LPS N-acetylglucosamine transferase
MVPFMNQHHQPEIFSNLKILVLSSGGGHWVQLLRLRAAWRGCTVHYATTDAAQRDPLNAKLEAEGERLAGFHVFSEANRWQKLRLLRQLVELAAVMVRVRPGTIITTGAAPGYFALRLGRLIGAKTVWVDSIANAEELSLSGSRVGRHADLWLTQWADLARPDGPHYAGSVI